MQMIGEKSLLVFGFVLFFTFAFSSNPISREPEKSLIRKIEVFRERDGLPNIFHKISTQKQIKIAYVGGSITEASEGWRDIVFDWFRIHFPFHAFYQINSTVGGQGSIQGAFRLDGVLREKPDLIFVECAVNDENDMSLNRRVQAMEGIVRKTWEELPNTDICFVYTTAVKFCVPLIEEGKPFGAVIDHEKVADHYGIPSIDMGLEVGKLVERGKILLTADPNENVHTPVFFSDKDHYHPLRESGHAVYAATVISYLRKMSRTTRAKRHYLPAPLTPDNWQDCSMFSPGDAELTGDWMKFPEDEKNQLGNVSGLYRGKPGSAMKFKFEGTELGILDCIGPGSGSVKVTVDGKTQEIKRFNHNCKNWHKHSFFLDKLKAGVHYVEITVSKDEFDKSLIVNPDPDGDPAIYGSYDWYPFGILVVGKLIKQ